MGSVAAPHGYPVVSMSVSSGTHEDSSALLLLTIDNVYSLVAILTCEGMSKRPRARKKIHLNTSMDFMLIFGWFLTETPIRKVQPQEENQNTPRSTTQHPKK